MTDTLTRQQVADQQLEGWEFLVGGIEAFYETGDFATGVALVDRVGAAAEAANHHPDVTLTYPAVHLRMLSHDVGGVTDRDISLARTIAAIARELGVAARPERLSRVELGLDATDFAAVGAFWAAVLGYDLDDDELTDPQGRQVTLWLQQTDAHEEPRQRFHVDVSVPPEQVQPRIAAGLAAGGTLVSDEHAPAFTVLADPEGNKACICTWLGRE